jgi:NAD+ diphosphatase
VLAGFCEVGENVEQTVAREVLEEVGIQIKNIRYFGSQYWPFPNSLMLAFTAEYAGGEIVLELDEMRAAGFYAADELPGRPSSKYSIANQLIDDFIQRQLG